MNKKLVLAIVVIAIVFTAIYYTGYTIENFRLVKTAGISIENLPEDAKIFIDGERKLLSFYIGNGADKRMLPGEHTILVAKDEYWPWMKNVNATKGQKITLHPFLLPKYPKIEIVEKENPNYALTSPKIIDYVAPSKESSILSSDGTSSVWIEENNVYSKKIGGDQEGVSPSVIFSSPTAIRNVEFLGDRNDVVIFNTEKGVFVIESDKTEPQNFQPLYDGLDVRFAKIDDTYYIMDKENLARIEI